MQLPRGKFRSVIKGVALNSLIQELAEVRYTGCVTISLRQEAISLVIQRGRYILAEYGSLRGDAAWRAMMALGEPTIDAILSDFTDPELKLALEFNDAFLLPAQVDLRMAKPPREKAREPSPAERPQGQPAGAPAPPAPEEAPAPGPATPLPFGTWSKVDMAQAIAADQGGSEIPSAGEYDELALLRMEMSALDDVDVEHIATKIRKNAKGIVKKLHLGHLMTEKED